MSENGRTLLGCKFHYFAANTYLVCGRNVSMHENGILN